MTQLSPSLRKAAVLISTLDARTADAILQRMSADDAAKVRSALVELDDIPADEQDEVLAEFLRQQDASALPPADDVALELDPAIEAAAATASSNNSPIATSRPAVTDESLAFLEHIEPAAIASLLRREHPQTVAVVVAHLPPQHAAAVLERLPATLATEALERIAWLDDLAPETRADLARGLRHQLAPHLCAPRSGTPSLAHLTAVLEAMDFRQRQRVVLQLGERNTPLVHRLGLFPVSARPAADADDVIAPRYRLDPGATSAKSARSPAATSAETSTQESWLTFEQLMQLDDVPLRTVFAAADAEISLLALTGAEPRLIARILRKLPADDAAVLRRRLEHPGPVRLRDIEQARAALTAVASRLAHEGTITLPSTVRFAAAV
jgi:flagellar motor switch protein FliG